MNNSFQEKVKKWLSLFKKYLGDGIQNVNAQRLNNEVRKTINVTDPIFIYKIQKMFPLSHLLWTIQNASMNLLLFKEANTSIDLSGACPFE